MAYCFGMRCKKSNKCNLFINNCKERGYVQVNDYSTQGSGFMDSTGLHVNYLCGDDSHHYNFYKEIVKENQNS